MNYFDEFIRNAREGLRKAKSNGKSATDIHAAMNYVNIATTSVLAIDMAELHKKSHVDLLKAMPCQCDELHEKEGGFIVNTSIQKRPQNANVVSNWSNIDENG